MQASGISNAVQVVVGDSHSLSLKSDGAVWAWGKNNFGQLGDGTTTLRPNPFQVPGVTKVIQIAAGSAHSLIVRLDGTAWAWGYNRSGQLGDGFPIDHHDIFSTTPVQTVGLTSLVMVAGGGEHSLAIKSNGTLWSWGENYSGELGAGYTSYEALPLQSTGLTNLVRVEGGDFHGFALKLDGTLWGWGLNRTGQLGDGTNVSRSTPVQATGLTGVVQVTMGFYHTIALKSDGTVWTWGYNQYGQLGNGNNKNTNAPAQVPGLTGVVSIGGGGYHSLALKSDGTVWAWGYNGFGQLGDGTTMDRSTPVQVFGLTAVVQVEGGGNHSLIVRRDGTVWGWGINVGGQVGDGSGVNRTTPVQVTGLTKVVQVSAGNNQNLAVKSDGTMWVWGNNHYGQLGDGTNANRVTPVQAPSITNVVQVACAGEHSLALKSDGTVWGFGYNLDGAVGDGTTIDSNTPIQVVGLTNQTYIAAADDHSVSVQALVLGTTIKASDITLNRAVSFSVSAYVSDQRGWLLANVPIRVGFDGVNLGSVTTDSTGQISVPIPNASQLTIGKHTFTMNYDGDRLFQSSTASGTVTVREDTTVKTSNVTGSVGGVVNLVATLTRNSNSTALNNKTVQFTVDGGLIGSAVTDAAGKAIFAYTLTESTGVGAHSIVASFNGDTDYNASSGSGTLTVKKSDTKVSPKSQNGSAGYVKPLTATLTRKTDGGTVSGASLTFKIDGNDIGTAVTDSLGIASLPYTFGESYSVGIHTILVNYLGSSNYNVSVAKTTLSIVKGKTQVVASAIGGNAGAVVTLKGKLLRRIDGLLLSGRTLRFQIEGVDIGTAITDSVGVAQLTYTIPNNLAKGKHIIGLYFDEDAFYVSSSDITHELTVK